MQRPNPTAETVSPDATGARLRCPRCAGLFVAGRTDNGGTCPTDGTKLVLVPSSDPPVADPFVGAVIERRYRVEAVLGSGSMGTVYRARQLNVGREVAIKILRQDRSADDATHARFKREAELIAKLSSPHTVTAFDSGHTAEGEPYIVMELLRGESLGQRLARHRRIEVTESIDACIQVLRSLSEAHAKGIVHRDLKPDNVYFAQVDGASGAREIVKVLDFGIAKLVGRSESTIDAIETQAGAVFGTPRYMSPEQAQGLPLDARSDLYTLGAILYQMIAGRPVFDDREAVVVMARHIKTAPTPLRDLGLPVPIPEELDNLVCDVLAKDPSLRPPTADAFAERLLRIYETLLSDSSGMRIARSTNSSATSSASFVSMPLVTNDAPTVMTPVAEATEAGPESPSRMRALAITATLVAVAAVAFALTARGKLPSPEPASAIASPALAPPSPVVEPPRVAAPAPAAEPALAVPEPGATQGRAAKGAPAKAPRGGAAPAAAPAPAAREPETPVAKPSNGYGIFE